MESGLRQVLFTLPKNRQELRCAFIAVFPFGASLVGAFSGGPLFEFVNAYDLKAFRQMIHFLPIEKVHNNTPTSTSPPRDECRSCSERRTARGELAHLRSTQPSESYPPT